MAEAMALYYPFIHFRDESWLKIAALYWSRIGRIVPPHYELHDSEVVRRLQGDLDLIHEVSPIDASFHVGMLFGEFLADNEHLLRKRYGIDKSDRWHADPTTMQRMGLTDERDPAAKLAHIYAPKIHPVLLERLTEAGLANHVRGWDWIGVHPKLADVYMAALAEEISRTNQLQPLTDDPAAHVAASGWTIERLAQVLLADVDRPMARNRRTEEEIEEAVAFLAVRAVVPKDRAIDVDTIVKIRKRYDAERRGLAAAVNEIAREIGPAIADIPDKGAFEAHVSDVVDRTIGQEIRLLNEAMTDIGVDSAFELLNMKLSIPNVLVSAGAIGGFVLSPPLALAGAAVLGIGKIARARHTRVEDALSRSDASYLLRLDRRLRPKTFMGRIGALFSRAARGI